MSTQQSKKNYLTSLVLLFALFVPPTELHAHNGIDHSVLESSGMYMYLPHGETGTWMMDYSKLATKTAVSGKWSEMWKEGELTKDDIVLIPEGVSVLYDVSEEQAQEIKAIALKGDLKFDTTKNTELRVGTILMYSGSFIINNQNPSITTSVVFTGDAPTDKEQFNLGFIAITGEVSIHGARKATSFYKVTAAKGATTTTLPANASWRLGDELFFSDSQSGVDASHWSYSHVDPKFRKALPQQWEIGTIKKKSGKTITLHAPLLYAHTGYVANITRNVELRSEATIPHEGEMLISERGHLMFMGKTKVTIQNIRIKDMGRTTVDDIDDTVVDKSGTVLHSGKNPRARYALHLHHNRIPFDVSGNVVLGSEVLRDINGSIERAIAGSPRGGIVNHDSFGDIKNNIVIGAAGSGIVGEDGTETGSVTGNLVIGTGQGTGGGDDGRFAPAKGIDLAYGGFGYWFRGPFLSVDNNIAAGYFKVAGFGYFLHPDFSHSKIPDIGGIPAEYKGKDINVNSRGIRSFTKNTAEGIFGDSAFVIFYSSVPHVISNFTALNGNLKGHGMDIRYTKSFAISNSYLTGLSGGVGIHSNKETKEIITKNIAVKGFNAVQRVD